MRHWTNPARFSVRWSLPPCWLLRGEYQIAFAVLLIPALVTLSILIVARLTYPRPQELEATPPDVKASGLPRVFWVYLVGAVLVAAGFADFPLIAYHFAQASTVSSTLIPVFYAVAMGMGGIGSLFFGRLFDRVGIAVLVPLTLLSALFAPLVFLGGFWAALVGVATVGAWYGCPRVDHTCCCGALWCRSSDVLRPMASSPRDMVCSGFWVVRSRHSVWRVTTGADCFLPGR